MRRTLVALTILAGCASPTELVVVVDSNLDVPAEIDSVVIEVVTGDGTVSGATQSLVEPDGPGFPLTLGVSPDDGDLGEITVRAIGRLGGRAVVEQEAAVTPVPGSSRTLYMTLLRGCVGRPCEETCGVGGCEAFERDTLEEWDGVAPALPDDACLASVWDADGDGEGSALCGGVDCDDTNGDIFAAQNESCDDIDNNCDGRVDENCDCAPIGAMQECPTDCGSTGMQECVGGEWADCVPPVEVCNGVDDDCDGFTDQGFDYVPVDRRSVSADRARDARILWAGDRFFVGWYQTRGDPRGVHLMSMQPDGTTIAGPTPVENDTINSFELAWSGSALAMLWWDAEGCGTTKNPSTCRRIRYRVFDADFMAVSDVMQLESNGEDNARVRVLWDGSAFVMSYSDSGETFFQRVDEMGQLVGPRFDTEDDGHKADTVWDGTQLWVVYEDDPNTEIRVGDTAGFSMRRPLVPMVGQGRRPEIVQTDLGFLIAYTLVDENALYSVALDAMGNPAAGPTMIAPNHNVSPTPREVEPGIAVAERQVFVSWVANNASNGLASFARLGRQGEILQGPTGVTAAPTEAQRTHLASDGAATVWVTWSQDQDPRLVEIARLACAP